MSAGQVSLDDCVAGENGEGALVRDCPCCDGTGTRNNDMCLNCNGTGRAVIPF